MSAWEMSLRARLEKSPWNSSGWDALVEEVAPINAPLTQKRALFEQVLAKFPTAAHYWKRYAEAEMAAGNDTQVKLVFNSCLLQCPSVPLWTSYLSFIKKMNEAKGPEGLGEVRKAYDYTLDRIGSSLEAGPIHQEYLKFLQAPQPNTRAYQALYGVGPAGQDDSHRVTVLRRAYQRAIGIPTHALDALWRAYEAFESQGANRQLTQRLLAEHRPRYHAARAALNTLGARRSKLTPNALALPPGQGGAQQQAQAQLWQELLDWEKSNPQGLDGPALSARVALTYDEALMLLTHYPDVWYGYSRWHAAEGGGGPAAAAQVLTRACKALPACTMLHFALADLKEGEGNVGEAEGVYSALAARLLPEAPDAASAENGAQAQLELSSEEGTLFWIRYMRFRRRNDSVAASRKAFLRARKWANIGWQVFVHSAHMEWHTERNDKVPRNIFELGLKAFPAEPGFIAAYAAFLLSQGDVDNARQLFERALAEPQPPLPIWDAYLQFESEHGSLAAMRSLEQRRAEASGVARGPADALHVMLLEHREMDLWPCSQPEKEHLQRVLGLAPPLQDLPTEAAALSKPKQQQAGHQPPSRQHHQPPSSAAGSLATSPASRGAGAGMGARGPYQGAYSVPGVKSELPQQQLPHELAMLVSSLPPANGQFNAGSPAPVDMVMDVLMHVDLSPEGIAAALNQQSMAVGPMSAGGQPMWVGQKRSFADAIGYGALTEGMGVQFPGLVKQQRM